MKNHWEKATTKKNKWLTRTTKNGELFSFDLIIYFCVVEPLGLYRFGYFGAGGSCRIISLLPFRCRAPLTHSHTHLYFNTKPRGGWRTWRSSNGWVHVHLWPLFSFYLLLFWRPYLSKVCVWEKGEEVLTAETASGLTLSLSRVWKRGHLWPHRWLFLT